MLSNQIFNNNANNIAIAEIIAKSVPKWIHSIRIENNESSTETSTKKKKTNRQSS